MKIILDSLPPVGRQTPVGLDHPWAVAAARTALGVGPRALSGQLKVVRHPKKAEALAVTGELAVGWEQGCDRCTRSLHVTLSGPVDLTYLRGTPPTEAELDLAADDLDLAWVQDGSLDLAAVVSEQLALWLSDRVVCGDDGTARADASDTGPCEVPRHDGGPELEKPNPFSALANWEPPK